MKVIKHVKENKMRFYRNNNEKVHLAINIDESSSEDIPIVAHLVKDVKEKVRELNTPDRDYNINVKRLGTVFDSS
jgi:hypothetical protein